MFDHQSAISSHLSRSGYLCPILKKFPQGVLEEKNPCEGTVVFFLNSCGPYARNNSTLVTLDF